MKSEGTAYALVRDARCGKRPGMRLNQGVGPEYLLAQQSTPIGNLFSEARLV